MTESRLNSIKEERILLSPLNWGLGHVTRTIPVIQRLIWNNNEIIICCDSDQEDIYRSYFPDLWYVTHEGYPFSFNGKGNWAFDLMLNFFNLKSFLVEEIRRVDQLIENFNPTIIISDQRFGFRSKRVVSVIISHQLNLPVSKLNFVGRIINRRLLKSFDEIWVPDTEKERLSGVLSQMYGAKIHFIGTCSRFRNDNLDKHLSREKEYEYLGIVTGPDPYNLNFLKLLHEKFSSLDCRCAIISPIDSFYFRKDSNIDFFYRPNHEEFLKALLKSETVVSRSGYSTLMDINETGNNAILIPTKGQKEQVYLAEYHGGRDKWKFCDEDEFLFMTL